MDIKIKSLTRAEMGTAFKSEILTAMRFIWPEGFEGENLTRTWICPPNHHPVHFVATDFRPSGSLKKVRMVISHSVVLWKDLAHAGTVFRVFGLGGVYTLPQFRGIGLASSVVGEATKHILGTTGDVAIATCKPELVKWYSRFGWVPIHEGRIIPAPQANDGKPLDEVLLMLFISRKGKEAEELFRNEPIYFGEDVW